MLIRIKCRAKWTDQRKWYESQRVKSYFAAFLKVSYTDKNEKSGILCGSIYCYAATPTVDARHVTGYTVGHDQILC